MSSAIEAEPESFRVLYEANQQRVRHLLTRMVGPQEAEDLTQIVFAKAAQALPRFRGEATTATWLYRIAANTAADWLRSRPGHEAKLTVSLPDTPEGEAGAGLSSSPPERAASPEQQLIRREMNDCIRGVVANLPERHRTILMLGELGGLAEDEIAGALGISRSNAKVRLHRARLQLKEALNSTCDFYRDEDNEFACEPKPAAACTAASRSACSGTKQAKDKL